jgi:hypothetical protein
MKLEYVLIFGVGASFVGLGLIQRKRKPDTNWKAFVMGGCTMLVLDFLLIAKLISF